MAKLLKYIYRICVLAGIATTFVSCEPGSIPNAKEEGGSTIIRLVVKTDEQMNVDTRAVSEDQIHDMHVLVYDNEGNLIGQKYQTGSTSVNVTTQRANGCTIYAIANTNKPDLFKGYDIHKVGYLKGMIHTISAWNELTGGDYLPMTGSMENVDITASGKTLSMEVKRMVAKITLDIRVKAGSGITINDYKIHNLPLASYYVPRPLTTEVAEEDTNAGDDASIATEGWTDSSILTAGTTSVIKTLYMFENRRGVNNGISQQSDKTSDNAPEHATYVEINGTVSSGLIVNWKIYLGANNTKNFNIKRNCQYTYIITLNEKYSDTRVTIDDPYVINLSETGTANCYLVSEKNKWYKFKATVRGNGTKTIKEISPIAGATTDLPAGETMNPTSVELVWETNGHKQVIDNYILSKGYVYFKTGASVAEGNAVIAVKDAGEILWSWHIWKTSFDLAGLNSSHTQKYKTSPKYLTGYNVIRTRYMTMMDRHLGAASNTPSQTDDVINTYGVHYQWGRKDPFPSAKVRKNIATPGAISADMVSIFDASGLLIDPMDGTHQVASIKAGNVGDDITYNIANGIKNPITFFTRMENDFGVGKSSRSWIYGSYNDGTTTSIRWRKSILLWGSAMKNDASPNYYNSLDTKKSIYDPCPEGWCLPTLEVWSNFTIGTGEPTDTNQYNCTEKKNFPYPNCFLDAQVFGRQFYINEDNTETAFYPCSGFRQGENGTISYIGQFASAWSSSIYHNSNPNGHACGILGAQYEFTHSVRFGHQSDTFPVRCVKESDMDKR